MADGQAAPLVWSTPVLTEVTGDEADELRRQIERQEKKRAAWRRRQAKKRRLDRQRKPEEGTITLGVPRSQLEDVLLANDCVGEWDLEDRAELARGLVRLLQKFGAGPDVA